VSNTYNRILAPLNQPKSVGHAERNVANIKSLNQAKKYFKKALR